MMSFPFLFVSSSGLLPVIPCTLILYLLYTKFFPRKLCSRRLPLLPGPFCWPIVGNIFDIPRAKEWITFSAWRKTYGKWNSMFFTRFGMTNVIYNTAGNVISVSIFGRSIIILNSAKAAIDLLEKRSIIYSDRPYMAMASDLVGYDHALVLTPYNERFRKARRLTKGVLGPGVVNMFDTLEERECIRLLDKLLDAPERFLAHIRKWGLSFYICYMVSNMSFLTYNQALQEQLYWVSHMDTMCRIAPTIQIPLWNLPSLPWENFPWQWLRVLFSSISYHGVRDIFYRSPRLSFVLIIFSSKVRYIPASLPGMGFRHTASLWRQNLFNMAELPYHFTQSQMVSYRTSNSDNLF